MFSEKLHLGILKRGNIVIKEIAYYCDCAFKEKKNYAHFWIPPRSLKNKKYYSTNYVFKTDASIWDGVHWKYKTICFS